jgi:cytochrome c oxidase accessory protein FixG
MDTDPTPPTGGRKSDPAAPGAKASAERVAPQERLASLQADGTRKYVHPADVSGKWTTFRTIVYVVLGAVLLGLPWLRIHGRPAILLDIPRRQFFLAGEVFGAQDGALLLFLFTGLGFGLLVLTSIAGRMWCATACPQTVFTEGVYRRIERLIEGPANERLKLDRAPWSAKKLGKRTVKWLAYTVVSLFIAHAILGYFFPVRDLVAILRVGPAAHPEAFAWTMAITALLLFDFGWFREQFCVVMCPYGRLQSVLTDKDSLVVGYDRQRGEPRGKLHVLGNGSCVDCHRCVAVCPTGIDIRDGLQLDCIGCTACIDACDAIMIKTKQPVGLIRIDSQQGLEGKPKASLFRPRLIAYAVAGLVGATVFGVVLARRTPFEATFARTSGAVAAIDGDDLRSVLRVRVTNQRPEPIHCHLVSKTRPEASLIIAPAELTLVPFAQAESPVIVTVPRTAYQKMGPFPVVLDIQCDGYKPQEARVPFVGP